MKAQSQTPLKKNQRALGWHLEPLKKAKPSSTKPTQDKDEEMAMLIKIQRVLKRLGKPACK